jgi:O-antigen/teichoic acid export membrane protein
MIARCLRDRTSVPSSRYRWMKVRTVLGAINGDALVRGSFTLASSTVLSTGLGFVFWALAARDYSPKAVGRLAGVAAIVTLISTAAVLGLPNTLTRHLSGTENPRGLTRMAVMTVAGAGGVITALCLLVLMPLLPGRQGLGHSAGAVAGLTALVLFTAVGSVVDAGLVAVRATGALLLKNLASCVIKVAVLPMLIPLQVTGLMLAYGTGTAGTALFGAAVLWRRLGRDTGRQGPLTLLRSHLQYSVGSYLGTLLGSLPATMVPLEVMAARGAIQTAWFAMAFQIARFLNFIPIATANVLFAEAQRVSLRRHLPKAAAGVYAVTVPAVIIMIVAAPYLLWIFGGEYSARVTGCLRLVALGAIPAAANYLVDTALISRDRTGAYVLANGAYAALVLSLVELFLPAGLTAAAAGWALAQTLSLVLSTGVLLAGYGATRIWAEMMPLSRRARPEEVLYS